MPTGYTHAVQDGKITDLNTFIWTCARAFGALIELRDSPNDGAKPEPFKIGSYHTEQLDKARTELARLTALTVDQATFEQANEINERVAYHEKAIAEEKVQRDRYEAMLEKVRSWREPSSEHVELKKFMEDQLVQSIDFDCGKPGRGTYHERELKLLKDKAVEPAWVWLQSKITKAQNDIDYHTQQLAEEQGRIDMRNLWVQQLAESLDGEKS